VNEEKRKTGNDIVGDLSWGTHLCLFYQTKGDLIDILVPYFKAGLESNEFCMWVTSEPLRVEEAKTSLRWAIGNLDEYVKKGQIEILDSSEYCCESGKSDTDKALQEWLGKEKQALERGFDGLRLSENISWLERGDWRNLTEYEAAVDRSIGGHRMLAICSYWLEKCGVSEVIDVVSNHQYALIKEKNRWHFVESIERKQAEEKARELALLKKLDQMRTNLLANVSHELRTPLATIKGYSTMILDYDKRLRPDEKREYLKSIDRASDRLTSLVDSLLDMSRLEAGLLRLETTLTDISTLIQEAVAEGRIRAPKHNIVADVETGLPRIVVDAKRIQQIIDNLLDNACKYSGEGTEVMVSAQRGTQELIISVSDQGTGIPVESLDKVFTQMYSTMQRMAGKKVGLGLGLPISKGLVEAHGGRIWLESEQEKGTRCSFTLPLCRSRLGVNQ